MTIGTNEPTMAQQQYNELLEQYKWLHVITSILVELEGGAVAIDRTAVEGYDLSGQLRIMHDPDTDKVIIAVNAVEE